jgi:hypothetical protein
VHRSIAFVVAMALQLAACSTTAPTAPPAATAAAPPSAGPTAAPSPSPVDVSAPFLSRITTANTGRLTFTGSIARGTDIADATGSLTFAGSATEQVTTITRAGASSTTDSIHVHGLGYTKLGDGPWLKDSAGPHVGADLWTLVRGLTSVNDAGVDTRAGVAAHRIELPAGTVIPAGAFGLEAFGLVDPTVALVFYATEDGTPLGLALTASATETVAGQTSDVRLTLDLDYAELGGAVAVAAPDHVWNRFTSKRYHYAIAYPGGFSVDTSQRGFDYLNGPSVTHVGGRRLTSHGRSLDSWSKTIINGHNAARLEYTLLSKQAHSLAGTGGLLLTSKYREHGQWLICYEVIAIRGSYVYDVFWISPLKTSAADLATWEQMLTTFAFS